MALSDEQLNRNLSLFMNVRGNIKNGLDKKLEDIKGLIEEGADVNAADGNDGGNTPLHMAARRGEPAVARLLVERGAHLTAPNWSRLTPLDLARTHNDKHADIITFLETAEESARKNTLLKEYESQRSHKDAKHAFKYKKRPGTSGAHGHLYETKLLCLVFLRALHDDQIEEFLLGTNVDGVGNLDDICLRYQIKDRQRPVLLFVQAKHKEDTKDARLIVDNVRSDSEHLRKYFESYVTIKGRFSADTVKCSKIYITENDLNGEKKQNLEKNEDPMFQGNFNDVESNFVIYTSAEANNCFFKSNININQLSEKVHDLIHTKQNIEAFQLNYNDKNIEIMTNVIMLERVRKLGVIFLNKILSEEFEPDVLNNELIERYHVVLKLKILKIKKNQPNDKDYYVWKFRPEFFESNCKYLIALKNAIFTEMLAKCCDQSKICDKDRWNVQQFLENPSVDVLSELIGRLIMYNENDKKMIFIFPDILQNNKEKLKLETSLAKFKEDDIMKAILMKLLAMEIKLDVTFGNLDMSFRGGYENNNEENETNYETKMKLNTKTIKKLASELTKTVMSKEFKKVTKDRDTKLIEKYHTVLKEEVLQLKDEKLENAQNNKDYCIWKFRPEFFVSNHEYLVAMRNAIIKEISTKCYDQSKISDKDRSNLENFLIYPNVDTLSELVGRFLIYNERDKKVKFVSHPAFTKLLPDNEKPRLEALLLNYNEGDITKAVQNKLLLKEIKLDIAYLNCENHESKSEEEKENSEEKRKKKIKNRIKHLVGSLVNLLKKSTDIGNIKIVNIKDDDLQSASNNTNNPDFENFGEENKCENILNIIENDIVSPMKTLNRGFVKHNGGIGSAVGNLLVLDVDTNMLKFNLNYNALPYYAAMFLKELENDEYRPINKDLDKYRINVCINRFPKYSFEGDEYDKKQVKHFLNKLWFYTNQVRQNDVEEIIKKELDARYNKDKDLNKIEFKIRSDAIFLIFHDRMQKWSLSLSESTYLNKDSKIMDDAKYAFLLENPLLTSLNLLYTQETQMQKVEIEFQSDALLIMKHENTSKILINVITESKVLSCIKVMQQFEKQDGCSIINFDHVLDLNLHAYNIMLQELQQTKIKTLIITTIRKALADQEVVCKLKEVIKKFRGEKIVIVSDTILCEEIKEYAGDSYRLIIDSKTELIYLTETSQNQVLEKSVIEFQGDEVPLNSVVNETARSIVKTEVLQALISNEKIEVGLSVADQICKYVKCTGMSVRLTEQHLSSKKEPLPWIVWKPNSGVRRSYNLDAVYKTTLRHYDQMKIEAEKHHLALFERQLFLHLLDCNQVMYLEDDVDI